MIATCPECHRRYRVADEKVGPQGARLRCQKCETIFRIDPPQASEATVDATAPAKSRVARAVVAESDPDRAKRTAAFLERWSIDAEVIDDGGLALLELHRKRPSLAVLGAKLAGVTAPVVSEILRRNPDLQDLPLVRVSVPGERASAPEFDADHCLEPGDVPDGLGALLESLGVGVKPQTERPAAPPPPPKPATEVAKPAPEVAKPAPEVAKPAAAPAGEGSAELKKAERLARIVISDIILYNEDKFARAAVEGNVAEALAAELEEASSMFRDRVSEELRRDRDFLVEELERRAEKKRAQA